MRRAALLLLVLSFLSPATALAKDVTARWRYTGWKCAACAGKVERTARSTKGVRKATATLDTLTIVFDDTKTDVATLSSKLVVEGFTFQPLTTTTSG